jgi:hypothetical protein
MKDMLAFNVKPKSMSASQTLVIRWELKNVMISTMDSNANVMQALVESYVKLMSTIVCPLLVLTVARVLMK